MKPLAARRLKLVLAFLAGIFSLAGLFTGAAAIAGANADSAAAPTFRITMLGTGTPVPSATQYGASTLIEAGGHALLFDCGRGCAIRLAQARRQLFTRIDGVFLTHLHSDHVVGLADLWLNGWTQGRTRPLGVWGPVGTQDMMAGLRSAFAFDIHMRGELEQVPASMTGLQTDVVEIQGEDVIFRQDGVAVTAFLVDHAAIEPAFGFRIDFAGRSVLLSGDTRPTANLIKYGAGVDIFVLDVMSPRMIENVMARRTARVAGIIVGHHTKADEAAKIFAQTKPRLAVYSHTINRPEFTTTLLAETRKAYEGAVVVAEDLMEIEIGDEILVTRARQPKEN